MYPKILYWKWNEELLNDEVLERKVNDVVKRSNFDLIAMSTHGMTTHTISLKDSILKESIKKAAELFAKHGRKFTVDVDAGRPAEFNGSFSKAPNKFTHVTRICDADLDENGYASLTVKIPEAYTSPRPEFGAVGTLSAWIVDACDDMTFAGGSEKRADAFCKITNGDDGLQKIEINAGIANAGKKAIIYPDIKINVPDRTSDEYRQTELEIIEELKDTGIFGITTDEWGLCTAMENSTIPYIYASESTASLYFDYCGRNLYDDLLYFHYSPKNDRGISILVINKYLEVIRNRMTEDDAAIYDKTKSVFGKDAFVGFHPTWYCAPNGFSVETMRNGMDWWQVKRDYSQTDERVMIPIRLAMARGARLPVWYNMWYSQSTLDIKTYYRETWVNARFGGRTNYLGYECYEPGVVLTLWQEGRLESCSEMEDVAAKLNDFQTSLPDSRVLCLFSMEQFTNWQISEHGAKTMRPRMNGHKDIVEFANGLFAHNVLFDLVPTSEIDRDKLRIDNEKIKYYDQDYDAVIVAGPNGMSQKAVNFVKACARLTENIVLVGEHEWLNDGSVCTEDFDDIKHHYPMNVDTAEIAQLLIDMNVKTNMTANSAVFKDGSVIYTTDGALNVGNPLEADFELDGHKIVFRGTDFLALRIKDGVPDYRFGSASVLTMDGRSLI